MPKVHHPSPAPTHPPKPHHPEPAPTPPAPSPALPALPQAPAAKDSFVKETLREIYENSPLVMLCTKPDLRGLTSQIPVIKEIADQVCPAFETLDQTIKR